jgi:hypothetical protein
MSREYPQLRVRIPPELKEDLEDRAAKANRTLTAEIVYRLQQSIEAEDAGMPPSNLTRDKLLKAITEAIKHLEEDK